MENRNTPVVDHHGHFHLCSMRCLSWSAIIFGALVAISLSALFNLFSLSIGLSAFPVTPEGKQQFAAWGFAGLVLIAIVTMFLSGWVTGYLARSYCFKRKMGELYGFGAWALAFVVTVFLASQVGTFMNQKGYMLDRNFNGFQLSHQIASEVNQATSSATQEPTSAETKDAATTLGIASFATFFILFMGALSASFGGRLGICYKRKEHPEKCPSCK